jgi:hypothetical protein
MGLSSKCFEILENRPSNYDLRHEAGHSSTAQYAVEDPLLSEDESEATEDEDEDDEAFEEAGAGGDEESESDAGSEEGEDVSEDESLGVGGEKRPKLRVREILFYEERVEAFRRRHGVLRP